MPDDLPERQCHEFSRISAGAIRPGDRRVHGQLFELCRHDRRIPDRAFAPAPGGRFIFTVPHPFLPYVRRQEKPVYFDPKGRDYFAGVDESYEGYIWRRDGKAVPVSYMHKTFADYFNALAAAGFQTLPKVIELKVTEEHLALDRAFFEGAVGYPLQVLFRIDVP